MLFRLFFSAFLLCIFNNNAIACSCFPLKTQQEEYNRSALVITGRIIAVDSVRMSSGLLYDRHGIKFNGHRFRIDSMWYQRVTVIIEDNFKRTTALPDTIQVLTGYECGYAFYAMFNPYITSARFIIYGDRWTESFAEKFKKGRRYRNRIVQVTHQNIFETGSCRRIQKVNDAELKLLEKTRS